MSNDDNVITTNFSRLGPDGHSGDAKPVVYKPTWGGPRPGSGRKPGVTDAIKFEMAAVAKEYAPMALRTLVDICQNGESDAARIMASKEILDRAYGKPTQAVKLSGAGGGENAPILFVTADMTQKDAVDNLAAAIKQDKL